MSISCSLVERHHSSGKKTCCLHPQGTSKIWVLTVWKSALWLHTLWEHSRSDR